MILSQTVEYAIRAMATLALKDRHEPYCSRHLSEEAGIPMHYLSKILRKLVEAKLLKATKGHRGGFILAKPKSKIKIIKIIEAVESNVPKKHCIFGWRMCNVSEPCILHDRWAAVNDAFQSWARETSLSDIERTAAGLGWVLKTNGSCEC